MAKDATDKATLDLLAKPKQGGYRSGAGRKTNLEKGKAPPRKQPSWRVSEEAINAIKLAAESSGHKPGDVLDWVMKNHKKIPKNI